jgi:hypothetical protein
MRPTPAQRPQSVVTTFGSRPWSSSTPATCPRRACEGLVSTCSLACSPANRPAPWRWTSSLGRPGGERGAAAGATAKRRPRPAVDPRASHALPTHDHLFPARPHSGSDDQAARRPQRPVEPGPPNLGCPAAPTSGIQRGADSADAEAADTGRLSVRRLSVRTPGSHRSPGHRTRVDTGRPRDQVDGRPHGGESDERRGRRPDILDGHDGGGRRLGGPNLARVAPSSALGNR